MIALLHIQDQFDFSNEAISLADVHKYLCLSLDPKVHIDLLSYCINMSFESAIVHRINLDQRQFIRNFRKQVIPPFER
ncbi:MAG TPA: hypothetical protein VLB04_11730 [Methanotrichaceae archaeon]|nr:hypothetical protein [Methanotrichaceae archaeon]